MYKKGYLSDNYYNIVKEHHKELETMIVYDRNYLIDYFWV